MELARVDASRCFYDMHWHAQVRMPHGAMVRIVEIRTCRPVLANGKWLQDVKGFYAERLEKCDHMVRVPTCGESKTWYAFMHERRLALGDLSLGDAPRTSISVGTVTVTQEWTGFRFRDGNNFTKQHKKLTEFQDKRKPREWEIPFKEENPEQLPVFKDAKQDMSGWEWRIETSLLRGDSDVALARAAAELQLRAAEALRCRNPRMLHFVLQRAEGNSNELQLLVFESAATGMAMECLRCMRRVLQDRDGGLLVDKPSAARALWDRSLEEDLAPEAALLLREVLALLLDRWG